MAQELQTPLCREWGIDYPIFNADVWWPNAPHRTLRNETFAEWDAAGPPPSGKRSGEGTSIGHRIGISTGEVMEWPRYAVGPATPEIDGDLEYAPLWAGESCSVVNDIKPAGVIVRDLVRDASTVVEKSTSTV